MGHTVRRGHRVVRSARGKRTAKAGRAATSPQALSEGVNHGFLTESCRTLLFPKFQERRRLDDYARDRRRQFED